MKRLLFVGAVLGAVVALGGTSGYNIRPNVAPVQTFYPDAGPILPVVGVPLGEAVGCRCSLYVDAGFNRLLDSGTEVYGSDGFAATGYLVPYYWDSRNLWVESQSSLHCAIAAKLDGGRIHKQVCPDIPVAARFGRIACTGYGIKGYDGGTGADLLEDAGPGPLPTVRTECWGTALPSNGQ